VGSADGTAFSCFYLLVKLELLLTARCGKGKEDAGDEERVKRGTFNF
jgi:hypothetical protein